MASSSAPPLTREFAGRVVAALRIRPLLPHEEEDASFFAAASSGATAGAIQLLNSSGSSPKVKEGREVRVILPSRQPSLGKEVRHVGGGATAEGWTGHRQECTVRDFQFDLCLGPTATQQDTFDDLGVSSYCDDAFEGKAATVMCFGMTGSGKTFTMSGRTLTTDAAAEYVEQQKQAEKDAAATAAALAAAEKESREKEAAAAKEEKRVKALREGRGKAKDAPKGSQGFSKKKNEQPKETQDAPATPLPPSVAVSSMSPAGAPISAQGNLPGGLVAEDGLQYRAARYIAKRLLQQQGSSCGSGVVVRASYLELYNETLRDLLSGSSGLKCRWSAAAQQFFVEDSMIVECTSEEDLLCVLREGQANRHVDSHLLNADSSRSHTLFTIYVETRAAEGAPQRYGKVTFVDLAGSERLKETGSSGEETKSINKSLFALGNVIEKLSEKQQQQQQASTNGKGSAGPEYIPYRSSILTQLLMDCLGGNCRTLLVACVTPALRFVEESLRTIHYAQRARHITTRQTQRVDLQEQKMHDLQRAVRRLRHENALMRRCLELPSEDRSDDGEAEVLTEEVIMRQLQHLLLSRQGTITTSAVAVQRPVYGLQRVEGRGETSGSAPPLANAASKAELAKKSRGAGAMCALSLVPGDTPRKPHSAPHAGCVNDVSGHAAARGNNANLDLRDRCGSVTYAGRHEPPQLQRQKASNPLDHVRLPSLSLHSISSPSQIPRSGGSGGAERQTSVAMPSPSPLSDSPAGGAGSVLALLDQLPDTHSITPAGSGAINGGSGGKYGFRPTGGAANF